jgi:hypothetical protein
MMRVFGNEYDASLTVLHTPVPPPGPQLFGQM